MRHASAKLMVVAWALSGLVAFSLAYAIPRQWPRGLAQVYGIVTVAVVMAKGTQAISEDLQ